MGSTQHVGNPSGSSDYLEKPMVFKLRSLKTLKNQWFSSSPMGSTQHVGNPSGSFGYLEKPMVFKLLGLKNANAPGRNFFVLPKPQSQA